MRVAGVGRERHSALLLEVGRAGFRVLAGGAPARMTGRWDPCTSTRLICRDLELVGDHRRVTQSLRSSLRSRRLQEKRPASAYGRCTKGFDLHEVTSGAAAGELPGDLVQRASSVRHAGCCLGRSAARRSETSRRARAGPQPAASGGIAGASCGKLAAQEAHPFIAPPAACTAASSGAAQLPRIQARWRLSRAPCMPRVVGHGRCRLRIPEATIGELVAETEWCSW